MPDRDEKEDVNPELKDIIPLLISQGWTPQEAIVAAATLSNSRSFEQERGLRRMHEAMDLMARPARKSTMTVGAQRKAYEMATAGFGQGPVDLARESEARRNERIKAQQMLKEYLMAQDRQAAEEQKKRALMETVHNLRRGLDNIGQARQHGYQLTPDGMYVVNQFQKPLEVQAGPVEFLNSAQPQYTLEAGPATITPSKR